MPLIRLLSPIVLAAAAVAAPPAAAAPWSAPVTISAPHTLVGPLDETAANTSTVAWWGWQDGTMGASFAVLPPGARTFEREQPIVRQSDVLDVQGYGAGRVVVLSQELIPEDGPRPRRVSYARFAVRVAAGDATGLRVPATLARAVVNGFAQLAIAPDGRGLVAFATFEPRTGRVLLRVARRSRSGRFSRPEVISGRGRAQRVAVAAGPRGDLVVAFVRDKRVLARVRRPGHGWGRLQTLAEPDGPTDWTLRAGVGDSGEVELLWRRRRLTQEGRPGLRALQHRRMAAEGSRFGAARTVEADLAGRPSELVAVPGGFAVGYTVRATAPRSRATPRVALLTPGAGAPLDVAAASGGVRDVRLAWSARLGLLATMLQPTANGNSDGIGLGALLAPGAAAFGPVEPVTPAENVHEVAPIVDRDGTPIAVWSARPEGTGPGIPIDRLRSVVRTAARSG